MVDSLSPLLGHTGAARWRLSRKARVAVVASIAAALAVVAVLALVDTPRPAVLLLPAYPQKARFQNLFFGNLAAALKRAHEAVHNAATNFVEKVKTHICTKYDAKWCPDAPIDTSLPPLQPTSNTIERSAPAPPPLVPAPLVNDRPTFASARPVPVLDQTPDRVTDSLGLPVLDSKGGVTFDSGGYANNAYTLSDWGAHDPGWIYQGDMDDGPQYTIDEPSGKLGPELHDPTFNSLSTLDDSVHDWADTEDTDPTSVDPWLENVGGNIY